MQIWKCDKCGKEFLKKLTDKGHNNLWEVRYNEWRPPIAEICDNCRKELDALLNSFFGKEVVRFQEDREEG